MLQPADRAHDPVAEAVAIVDEVPPWMRTAGTLLEASAGVAVVGLGFLFAMYAGFAVGAQSAAMAFGWLNDMLAIVQLALMVPGVVAVHRLLAPIAPRASGGPLLAGALASIAAVSVLQGLFVAGALTFEQEVGPVLLAYLPLAIWFVATGRLGGAAGVIPGGTRSGILAASYLGYPVWALRVGRRLRGRAWRAAAPATRPAAAGAARAVE